MSTTHNTRNFKLEQVREFSRGIALKYEELNRNCQKFPLELVHKMYELGLLQVLTPKQYEGDELPVKELIHVARELGYGSASMAATFIGNTLGYSGLVMYANDELKKDVCRDMSKNFNLWSFGMTEGETGSDLLSTKTTARKIQGGYLINGEKNFITNATYCTNMVLFARVLDQDGHDQGISCFYLPGETEGLIRGPVMDKVGWQKANTGTLIFKNVKIPNGYLLGKVGNGLRILTHCLNRSKTLLGGVSVGIGERAIDLALNRLSSTKRFDKPLIEQPAIRHLIAKLHTKNEAAWLLTQQAAMTWDEGKPAVKEASMAKLFGGATAVEIASQTMELFGARGFFNDFEISRLIMDAKAIEIVEGPSLVQELLIAKEVLRGFGATQSHQSELFDLKNDDLRKVS